MFYAPEILSYKNKTELSLVYYISTAKNPKRFSRKDVVELDVESILEQMKNPKVPFALRLYSYLLKGIVKIWVMKVDFYKNKTESLLLVKKLPNIKREVNNNNTGPINLRVIEEIISEVEDNSSLTNGLQENHQNYYNNNNDYMNDYINDFNIQNPFNNEIDGFIGESMGSYKKIVKNRIDKNIEINFNEIIVKKSKTNPFEIPNLAQCYISDRFEKFFHKNMNNQPVQEYFEIDSIEDPRISSSLSQERSLNSQFNVKLENEKNNNSQRVILKEETKAIWFYNILVSAAKGEIRVYQEKPFSELIIE